MHPNGGAGLEDREIGGITKGSAGGNIGLGDGKATGLGEGKDTGLGDGKRFPLQSIL